MQLIYYFVKRVILLYNIDTRYILQNSPNTHQFIYYILLNYFIVQF